jgi:surfeit locus 1 family protein
VTGNLHWPDEVDSFTPARSWPAIWFARDVPAMAAALGSEPCW